MPYNCRISSLPTAKCARLLRQYHEPLFRWLAVRYKGIAILHLKCHCCSGAPDECRGLRGFLPALLGCLRSVPVDLSVYLTCWKDEQLFLTDGDGPMSELFINRPELSQDLMDALGTLPDLHTLDLRFKMEVFEDMLQRTRV
ncbi:hypothetical protein WJX73_001061 [Symbiochloris irregularis]|uniref:Uncharacterized protein n=1 Tax=Symbiochloris irregularis TaxID=706552 RepID=A0AAW1P7S6_9CHLO